jgi:hypothetical protein
MDPTLEGMGGDADQRQLAHFTPEAAIMERELEVAPADILAVLNSSPPLEALSFNLGGTSARAYMNTFGQGAYSTRPLDRIDSADGEAVLRFIQNDLELWDFAVGLGTAGKLDGSAYRFSGNMEGFAKLMQERFGGDFHQIDPRFTSATVKNDGVDGVLGAVAEVLAIDPNSTDSVLFFINGTGTNTGIYHRGVVWGFETGHILLEPDFITHSPASRCGAGHDGVCIEQASGGEAQKQIYLDASGKPIDGAGLRQAVQAGDVEASAIYDTAAHLGSLMVQGTLNLAGAKASKTVVVLDGSVTFDPEYRSRLEAQLKRIGVKKVLGGDKSRYPTATGAALTALLSAKA